MWLHLQERKWCHEVYRNKLIHWTPHQNTTSKNNFSWEHTDSNRHSTTNSYFLLLIWNLCLKCKQWQRRQLEQSAIFELSLNSLQQSSNFQCWNTNGLLYTKWIEHNKQTSGRCKDPFRVQLTWRNGNVLQKPINRGLLSNPSPLASCKKCEKSKE